MQDSRYAWHFSTGKVQLQDKEIPVTAGLILKTDKTTVRFDACVSALDALRLFAVHPHDRIIVSRVKLSGEIVENGSLLLARQREHLWTADAATVLEHMALAYVLAALDWLHTEGIVIPDPITEALHKRQQWFAGEISQVELYQAAEALEIWATAQPHPADQALVMPELYDVLTVKNTQYTTQDWLNHWQTYLEAEPVKLARLLAVNMRHETQFIVFEIPEIAYHCRAIVVNYRGWKAALTDAPEGATDYLNKLAGWQPMSALELVDAPPPEPYFSPYHLRIPERTAELHRRLMLLAPTGYSEGT